MERTAAASELAGTRNMIGLLVALGVIDLIYSGVVGAPDFFLWIFAVAAAGMFYFQAGNFLAKPGGSHISGLQNMMNLFIIAWVGALVVALVFWGGLSTATIIGVLLCLVGTFLLQRFVSQAKVMAGTGLNAVAAPYEPQGAPTTTVPGSARPAETRARFCPNCGKSLEGMPQSNFCPNCGRQL